MTRLLLGPKARVQAPPNLSDSTELGLLLRAGVDDWGGVSPLTPDHVNPERPVAEHRQARRAHRRGRLRAARAAGRPAAVRAAARAVAGPAGAPARRRAGRPGRAGGRGPDPGRAAVAGAGRVVDGVRAGSTCTSRSTPSAAPSDRRSDFDAVYGDWSELRERTDVGPRRALHRAGRRRPARCSPRCCTPSSDPAGLSDAEYLALLGADGTDLEHLCRAGRRRPRATSTATTSPTSSTGTSTSPTSATPAAGSARSPSGAPTPTPTRCRWSRSATGSTRRGPPARPRSACRAASTPTCPAPRTSTSPAR